MGAPSKRQLEESKRKVNELLTEDRLQPTPTATPRPTSTQPHAYRFGEEGIQMQYPEYEPRIPTTPKPVSKDVLDKLYPGRNVGRTDDYWDFYRGDKWKRNQAVGLMHDLDRIWRLGGTKTKETVLTTGKGILQTVGAAQARQAYQQAGRDIPEEVYERTEKYMDPTMNIARLKKERGETEEFKQLDGIWQEYKNRPRNLTHEEEVQYRDRMLSRMHTAFTDNNKWWEEILYGSVLNPAGLVAEVALEPIANPLFRGLLRGVSRTGRTALWKVLPKKSIKETAEFTPYVRDPSRDITFGAKAKEQIPHIDWLKSDKGKQLIKDDVVEKRSTSWNFFSHFYNGLTDAEKSWMGFKPKALKTEDFGLFGLKPKTVPIDPWENWLSREVNWSKITSNVAPSRVSRAVKTFIKRNPQLRNSRVMGSKVKVINQVNTRFKPLLNKFVKESTTYNKATQAPFRMANALQRHQWVKQLGKDGVKLFNGPTPGSVLTEYGGIRAVGHRSISSQWSGQGLYTTTDLMHAGGYSIRNLYEKYKATYGLNTGRINPDGTDLIYGDPLLGLDDAGNPRSILNEDEFLRIDERRLDQKWSAKSNMTYGKLFQDMSKLFDEYATSKNWKEFNRDLVAKNWTDEMESMYNRAEVEDNIDLAIKLAVHAETGKPLDKDTAMRFRLWELTKDMHYEITEVEVKFDMPFHFASEMESDESAQAFIDFLKKKYPTLSRTGKNNIMHHFKFYGSQVLANDPQYQATGVPSWTGTFEDTITGEYTKPTLIDPNWKNLKAHGKIFYDYWFKNDSTLKRPEADVYITTPDADSKNLLNVYQDIIEKNGLIGDNGTGYSGSIMARFDLKNIERLPLDPDSLEFKNLEKLAREGNPDARRIMEEINLRYLSKQSFAGLDEASLMPTRSEYNRLMGIYDDKTGQLITQPTFLVDGVGWSPSQAGYWRNQYGLAVNESDPLTQFPIGHSGTSDDELLGNTLTDLYIGKNNHHDSTMHLSAHIDTKFKHPNDLHLMRQGLMDTGTVTEAHILAARKQGITRKLDYTPEFWDDPYNDLQFPETGNMYPRDKYHGNYRGSMKGHFYDDGFGNLGGDKATMYHLYQRLVRFHLNLMPDVIRMRPPSGMTREQAIANGSMIPTWQLNEFDKLKLAANYANDDLAEFGFDTIAHPSKIDRFFYDTHPGFVRQTQKGKARLNPWGVITEERAQEDLHYTFVHLDRFDDVRNSMIDGDRINRSTLHKYQPRIKGQPRKVYYIQPTRIGKMARQPISKILRKYFTEKERKKIREKLTAKGVPENMSFVDYMDDYWPDYKVNKSDWTEILQRQNPELFDRLSKAEYTSYYDLDYQGPSYLQHLVNPHGYDLHESEVNDLMIERAELLAALSIPITVRRAFQKFFAVHGIAAQKEGRMKLSSFRGKIHDIIDNSFGTMKLGPDGKVKEFTEEEYRNIEVLSRVSGKWEPLTTVEGSLKGIIPTLESAQGLQRTRALDDAGFSKDDLWWKIKEKTSQAMDDNSNPYGGATSEGFLANNPKGYTLKRALTYAATLMKGPKWLRKIGLSRFVADETELRNKGYVEALDKVPEYTVIKRTVDQLIKGVGSLNPQIVRNASLRHAQKISKAAAVKRAYKGRGSIGDVMSALVGTESENLGFAGYTLLPAKGRELALARLLGKMAKTPRDVQHGKAVTGKPIIDPATGKPAKGLFDYLDEQQTDEFIQIEGVVVDPRLNRLKQLWMESKWFDIDDQTGLPKHTIEERKAYLDEIAKITNDLINDGIPIPKWVEGHEAVASILKGPMDLQSAHVALFDFLYHGTIPNRYNIRILKKLMGDEFAGAFAKHRSITMANLLKRSLRSVLGLNQKQLDEISSLFSWFSDAGSYTIPEMLREILTLPRTMLASFDDSVIMRQGFFTLFQDPKLWVHGLGMSLKLSLPGNEQAARVLATEFQSRPHLALYKNKYGAALPDLAELASYVKTGNPFDTEEAQASKWTDAIPYIQSSARAYGLTIWNFRYQLIESTQRSLEKSLGRKLNIDDPTKYDIGWGWNPFRWNDSKKMTDLERMQKATDWINNMTGRGRIWREDPKDINVHGPLKSIMLDLGNIVFWSPRFFTSRIRLLPSAIEYARVSGQNPVKASMALVASPIARYMVATSSMLLAAKYIIPGMDADINWRSTSFMKVRVGNTRFDLSVGMGPIIRSLIGLMAEQETSTDMRVKYDANEILARFLTSKFSPVGSAIVENVTGQGYFQEDTNLIGDMGKPLNQQSSTWYKFLIPMFIEAVHEAIQEEMLPYVSDHVAKRLGMQTEDKEIGWENIGRILLAAGAEFSGISAATYRNKEDIAAPLISAAKLPPGTTVNDLPAGGGFRDPGVLGQGTIRDIQSVQEARRGETYTKSVQGKLTTIRNTEQSEINNIGTVKVEYAGELLPISSWIKDYKGNPPNEVKQAARSKLHDIRREAAIARTIALEDEGWAQEKTPSQLAKMSYKEQIYHTWKAMASETRSGDEYNAKQNALEDELKARADKGDTEAKEVLDWLHMQTYATISIPHHILILLSDTTQMKYNRGRSKRVVYYGATPEMREAERATYR